MVGDNCIGNFICRAQPQKVLESLIHHADFMKPQSLILLFLFAIIALGCMSPDSAMKSFLNQHSSELVARWGPPQQRMPDGQGGEIWIYSEQRQWTTPGQVNTTAYGTANTYGNVYRNPNGASYYGNSSAYGNATTTFTPAQTRGYAAHRSFFVNGDGIIYRYAWKGL